MYSHPAAPARVSHGLRSPTCSASRTPALFPTPASPLALLSCCHTHDATLALSKPVRDISIQANSTHNALVCCWTPKSPTPTRRCSGQSLARCCQTRELRPQQQQPLPPLRQRVPWRADGWHCCCGCCRCCQHSRQAPVGQHKTTQHVMYGQSPWHVHTFQWLWTHFKAE